MGGHREQVVTGKACPLEGVKLSGQRARGLRGRFRSPTAQGGPQLQALFQKKQGGEQPGEHGLNECRAWLGPIGS